MRTTIQQFSNITIKKLLFWKRLLSKQRFYFWTITSGFVVILMLLSIFVYNNIYNNSIKSSLKDSRTLKTEEALKETAVSEVNKLFELPIDVEVTIGTITNIDELKKKQKYFAKAKNGDLLLIYPDKTIIYDPKTKTIVDVAGVKLLK